MLIISDTVWNEIKNIIPEKESRVGRPRVDQKLVLSGIFYIMVTGAQWHRLPDYYGRPTTVHGRFRSWINEGIFAHILSKSIDLAVQQYGEPEAFINDTSSAKAPLAKFSGKNPTHDSKLLTPHLDNLEKFLDKPKVMITDSAWDVKKLRHDMARKNIALFAATNPRRNPSKPKIRPGGRWKIEQIFGIQQWNRGIKFCWTKTKESFLALCQFASAIHNFKLIGIFV